MNLDQVLLEEVVPGKGLLTDVALPLLQLQVDLTDVFVHGPLVVEVLATRFALDPVLVADLLTLVDGAHVPEEVAVPGVGLVADLALVVSQLEVNFVDVLPQRALPVERLAAVVAGQLVLHAQVVGQHVVVQAGAGKSKQGLVLQNFMDP